MAEVAHAMGKGGSIKFKGKDYELLAFNVDMIAMFEVWLENQAWQRVERLKGKCSAENYKDRHDAVSRMIAAGEFAYGSQAAAKAAVSRHGQEYILYLMLSSNEDMTEQLAHEIFESEMDEIIARMKEANRDPKANRPAAAPAAPVE